MDKERICLIVTGALCLFGCVFLSIYNVIEANYCKADIIPKWEYNEPVNCDVSAESLAESDGSVSGGGDETASININTASAQQIAEFLPGIGSVKAKAIVEYRELAGGFVSVDELLRVDGIGEKTLERIKPYCRISD